MKYKIDYHVIIENSNIKVKCLVDNANPKYLNCKFVLATVPYDARDYLTEGKIYTMVDGRFEHDQEKKWPFCDPIENEADLIAYFNNSRYDVFGKESCSNEGSAQVIIIKEDDNELCKER